MLDLRARRIRLGLRVAEVAYAARLRAQAVVDPSLHDALRIDAVLAIVEAGGSLEVARAASVPGVRGPKPPPVFKRRAPSWPDHSGKELLAGQCFKDVRLRNA